MRCKSSLFKWEDFILSFKITEFTSTSFGVEIIGVEINLPLQAGFCPLIRYIKFFNYICMSSSFLQGTSFVPICIMMFSGFFRKQLNVKEIIQLWSWAKTNFHFLFLDSFASLRTAIIDSRTRSVVLVFHFSASMLLSVLLVRLNISGCVLVNVGGVSDCFVDL